MTVEDLRIRDRVERGPRVRFTFDGQAIEAYTGESVAAALWATGMYRELGTGDRLSAAPASPYRVLFCMMGVCQQCVVRIEGARIEACRVPVGDGLVVRSE